MRKKHGHSSLSLAGLLFTALWVSALCLALPAAALAAPGDYNPGDISIINALINNNPGQAGLLGWTPAPADGSYRTDGPDRMFCSGRVGKYWRGR